VGETILLNDGWQFAQGPLDQADPAGLEFTRVDLPHDWLIYDSKNLYADGIGWYRRYLHYKGQKRVFLYFEGVYMDCSLYVNGTWIGDWKNGYTSFEYEITQALQPGQNEILLRVVHQAPNSRWYSGAGIYRSVWLKTRGDNYLATDGIYVCSRRLKDSADWLVSVDCELEAAPGAQLTLLHTIFQGETPKAHSRAVLVPDRGTVLNRQELVVEEAELWSPQQPRLYRLVTTLADTRTGQVLDTVEQRIGFKEVSLSPTQGLLLNGSRFKLNGVCEHHDLGALGAAFNKGALRRRLELLKQMGVNAIRTGHSVPAKGFMELADELGFLVISEAFDVWELSKTPFDYARFFPQWVEGDVASWVRRDRNHPSLLMWSIGNEILDTHLGERGFELTKLLMDLVRRHDPRGNGLITFASNYLQWENTQVCAELLDAVGYNYGANLYRAHREQYPHWAIYGSETSAVVQSRGIYHFPLEASILGEDDGQCSALGNSPVSWGAKSTQACLDAEREAPFSLGQFIWTGFDYIGEPTPYHSKNSFFGQLDTAGFPKDSYYIYQAAWTDYGENPMVHLYPHWDWSPGQIVDVRVCSNAPVVVLELNGQELGRRDMREPEHLYVTSWKVPYLPGELKAKALDEQGTVLACAVRRSFDDPARIRLKADKKEIQANGTDLIFVEISMEDAAGNPVENAVNRVEVRVSGAGRLVGLDNGDSTDYDSYKGTSRRLFSGRLLAIIAARLEPGEVVLDVSSPGLPKATAVFHSLPAAGGPPRGVAAQEVNQGRPVHTGRPGEVPLRKIELVAEGERVLTSRRREITVQARLFPVDTSYPDLTWRVVGPGGVDSHLARIVEQGEQAVRLLALGDGQFRLRCLSRNGTAAVRLFAELEFAVVGLGKLCKDPYQFVSGSLFDAVVGEAGPGNERGVATARGVETQIGFTDLDFGPGGSDTVTIPIFALTSGPYPLQLWEGKPGEEGSVLLLEAVYQKPSRWNVYQSETFRLHKRLRGVTSLWIVTQDKLHIKGFSFERQRRAFARIPAAECDRVYGDQFVIRGERIEQIGNNVTLDFGELDFGPEGAAGLILCGRTPLAKAAVQLSVVRGGNEERQQVEFVRAEGYEEQVFALEPLRGRAQVRLIFLPGSQFDLAWLQFLPIG